ncbi:MAG TPA: FmdB family zinc ribbon protein [Mycobacteriales bacterium]|nr:FmdB family zinc ribbon protein [Mycobacteriales bacterium]
MPTYQYACTSCGERLEVVQKFSDDPLTICPSCAGALRKVFSPVGVVFKGSGFYKTDSRTSASKSASASPSGGSGGTDTSTASSDSTSTAAPSTSGGSETSATGSTSGGSTSGGSGSTAA